MVKGFQTAGEVISLAKLPKNLGLTQAFERLICLCVGETHIQMRCIWAQNPPSQTFWRSVPVKIKSQKDFFSGLMFTVVGASFGYGATSYTVGTGARMGPGYFPLLLGVILALLGAIILFKSLVVETPDGEPVGAWAWKPLFYIIAGNLLFGILLGGLPSIGFPAMGLIVAIFGTTIVVSMAGDEFKFSETIVLSIILSLMSYAAFIMLLKLQFPVWPSFISG
jgi:hypothetical protein